MTQTKRLFAWLLTGLLLLGCLTGCDSSGETVTAPVEDTGSDADWTVLTEGAVVLENDRLKLELDAATTHFSVTDKLNGQVHYSVPQENLTAISAEVQSRLTSELALVYYDKDSTRLTMFSSSNSVDLGRATVKTKGNAVRIYYDIGKSASNLLLPVVMERETFEIDILENGGLASGQKRRLKRNYVLYSATEKPEDYDQKLAEYPILAEKELYILDDMASDLDRIEVSDLLTEAGYTREQYEAAMQELGITLEKTAEAGFLIPVEYTLESDGFSARLLTDKIKEHSEEFKLVSVDFLEYFAGFGTDTEGEFLVPDGVGATIAFNTQKGGSYYQTFYGDDGAISTTDTDWKGQNACLPVWGVTYPGGGILGTVTAGEEIGALNAKVYSAANPSNNAYVTFTLRAMDTTDIGSDRNIPVYNLYSKHLVRTGVAVRYVLMDGTPTVRDYALRYRQMLTEQGILAPLSQGETPLLLDYLGMIETPTTVMGIPYDRAVVLSTLDGIMQDMDALQAANIRRVELRLFGSERAGLEYTAHNGYSLSGDVGDKNTLLSLADRLTQGGGRLYLDADPTRVFRDTAFDGYDLKLNTARLMNRSLIRVNEQDFVGNSAKTDGVSSFLVSPVAYSSLLQGFVADVDALEGAGKIGLSCGDLGNLLTGDYHQDRDVDRTMSRRALDEALDALSGRKLTADGANGYILAHTDLLYNVPLTTTAFDIQEQTVPFLPMVLHGYVEYAGAPLNLAEDSRTAWLQTLSYGAVPYYRLITEDNAALSETSLNKQHYTLSSDGLLDTVIARYTEAAQYLNRVRCAEITAYRWLTPEVSETTFANGVSILVNYGSGAYTEGDTEVPPLGYTVLGQEGGN